VPAKIVRALSDRELAWKAEGTATYQALTRRCFATLREVVPRTVVEPGRPRFTAAGVVPLVERKQAPD
jgi:phenylacetic acid degradation protein